MPTYEYICEACSAEWEVEQSIKDAPVTVCVKCKKKQAKRQISRGAGFILKGGGWYSDLYSSAKPGSSTKTDTSSSTSSESSTSSDSASSKKSESPAAK